MNLVFIGADTEELEEIARRIGISIGHADSVDSVAAAEPLWITPASYPEPCAPSASQRAALFGRLRTGGRAVCEFDFPFDTPVTVRRCNYERLVVRQTDHRATSWAAPLDLLDAHDAYIQTPAYPCGGPHELITIARVSGFDRAVYGLPEHTVPGMVELTRAGALLWCATSVGRPAARRYKPLSRWRSLLLRMLLYLCDPDDTVTPEEIAEVEKSFAPPRPTYPGRDRTGMERRREAYRGAIRANIEWYHRAGMLVEEDGSAGVLEGYESTIEIDGSQPLMLHEGVPNERADCNIQSAAAFLAAGNAVDDLEISRTGTRLLEFTINNFQYTDRSVYSGLWRWFRRGYESTVFYSDDNGWACFFALLCGLILDDERATESGLRGAVALRDTWGANGHRRRRIDLPHFYELDGRRGLRTEAPDRGLYGSPHYEAASMAAMGLATLATGDTSFVSIVAPGIDHYLARWPEGITFQHSENDDGSKFVVALLFYGEALGEKRYHRGAREILDVFLDAQLDSGAIPDIDRLGKRYGKNRSNADYGTFESSLFCEAGDLVTDQVYGSSFLLLALFVAHRFLGEDTGIARAMYGLADYLVAIQLGDTGHRFLDGAWMRSFDPIRWEYFGSAGDWGYGPYLLETGWCQAVIDIALAWILDDTSLETPPSARRQEELRNLADRFTERQRADESRWRDLTPRPTPRRADRRSDTE